jgi:hypothetical protein
LRARGLSAPVLSSSTACRLPANCGCETFWDAGSTLWIGDQTNDRYSETQLPLGDLRPISL